MYKFSLLFQKEGRGPTPGQNILKGPIEAKAGGLSQ